VGVSDGDGAGRGKVSISLVWMSLSGGECSTRDRREALLKCCVSRLLERAARAKRMLARVGGDVEKLRRLVREVEVEVRRTVRDREVRDMAGIFLPIWRWRCNGWKGVTGGVRCRGVEMA